MFSLVELLKTILLNCTLLKKMKNKKFWVDATFYCNDIWTELKNWIINKCLNTEYIFNIK